MWLGGRDSQFNQGVLDGSLQKHTFSAAYNFYTISEVIAPIGVTLQLCEPDFSKYPKKIVCNNKTITEMPCDVANSNATTSVCKLQLNSDRFQMIKVNFLTEDDALHTIEWGCFTDSDLSPGMRLNQPEFPNKRVKCTLPQHALSFVGNTCEFTCEADYNPNSETFQCEPKCDLSITPFTTCPEDHHSSQTCNLMTLPRYQCGICLPPDESRIIHFIGRSDNTQCEFEACGPGKTPSSDKLQCVDCPANMFSAQTGDECEPCEIGYESDAGMAACTKCFIQSPPESANCVEGSFYSRNLPEILLSISNSTLSSDHSYELVRQFCDRNYACLPCPPGSFKNDTMSHISGCSLCQIGKYQPNFHSSVCFPCSHGQSTLQLGSTNKSQCVCVPGFE